ncbi:hypothetical protein NBRC116592_34420 [Colwellia sp. KU-HH00111]|uniref:FG-GAP repeat domain-containing protein n=1 Tax=Colwellia sp. KU-HH00111 TaxID=3127652 RepID=UPI0031038B20
MKIKSFLILSTILTNLPIAVLAQEVTLTLEIIGKGKVNIESNNTFCTETCQQKITSDSIVSLNFEETSGYKFSHWESGSCDAGEEVLMNPDKKQLIAQEFRPKEVAFADFNGDGLQDIATISLFSSQLTVSFSLGNEQYQLAQTFSAPIYSSSMTTADWEGDGDTDIFVVDYKANAILSYMNDGNGNFTLTDMIEIANEHPYSLAIADINQDGLNDLLLGSFSANISADSLKDIVNSVTGPSLRWYANEGDNQFSLYQDIPTEGAFFKLAVGKLTGSSNFDIVGTAINLNKVLAYRLTASDYIESTIYADNYVYGVALGDIDQNNLTDVLVTSYYGQDVGLLTQHQDGSFITDIVHRANDGLTSVSFADIDSNGIDDIVWGEFDNRVVNWIPTDSLKTCVVNMNSNRTVVANFIESSSDDTINNNNVTAPPSLQEQSSSGGSFGLSGLLVLSIYNFRKRFINYGRVSHCKATL